jgi:hypothetical protein
MKDIQKIKEFFSKPMKEGSEEYFKPKARKDKSNPNFLYVDIAYPEGSGVLSVGGSKTMSGQDREEGAAKALAMGNAIVKKLEAKYNIEDIEVKDLKNGKVQVFAVSDDFIKMASPSLDEAKTAIDMAKKQLDQLGAKYEMSGNKFKPFKVIYKPIGQSDEFYDTFEDIVDLFNLKGVVKSSMSETKEESYMISKSGSKSNPHYVLEKPDGSKQINMMFSSPEEAKKYAAKKNLKISSKKGYNMNEAQEAESLYKDWDQFEKPSKIQVYLNNGKTLEISPLKLKGGKRVYDAVLQAFIDDRFDITNKVIQGMMNNLSEAKEEDKVDTITMDIPLFIRMLEYSREDAAEDMDLHDVTEKAISLGKERGILQMDDYDEIVGGVEKVNETRFSKPTGSPYEQKDLYAQELFGIEYFNWLDFWEQFHIVQKYKLDRSIITKEGKEVNLKASKLSSAEYQKAKKLKDFKASDWKWNASEDLYTKVNEGIERKIFEALDKINEELCPAGKAYRKRRIAAGEKSSAYLSGRAVKVCKGQMSGKKKKK